MAVLIPEALSIIGMYFEKRLGIVCGIIMSGGSVGGLVMSPVLTWRHQLKIKTSYGHMRDNVTCNRNKSLARKVLMRYACASPYAKENEF